MPSVVNVGGIRMSVSTASGRWVGHRRVQRHRVAHGLDQLEVGGLRQQARDALPHEVVVVGEDDAERA